MAANVVRSFEKPDDSRTFTNGRVDLIKVGPLTFGLETLEPGWRWSVDVEVPASPNTTLLHRRFDS